MRQERWTIKSPVSGETLAQFVVEAEPVTPAEAPAGAASSAADRTNGSSAESGEKLTDPQKRFLFRLLAAQKVEGKAAEQHLKEHFRVAAVKDIPKQAASSYIDQLVKDQRDARAS